jgi:hypothetical protein
VLVAPGIARDVAFSPTWRHVFLDSAHLRSPLSGFPRDIGTR